MSSIPADITCDAGVAALQTLFAGRRVLVLTGAGCSTDSGIPDYRDRDGAWKRAQPVQYRDFVHSDAVRQRYWARSFVGWPRMAGAEPNAAHRALAALERAGWIEAVITQNVDGLHQKAGQQTVVDLHGRLDAVVCLDCERRLARSEFQTLLAEANADWQSSVAGWAPDGDADLEDATYAEFRVPGCSQCGGVLKPAVVFFGEHIPAATHEAAREAVAAAEALLVVGSSLMVWSGFRLVRAAAERGLPVAAVNQGHTRADALIDLKLDQPCSRVLQVLSARYGV